jgi:hypothetical protein
MKLTHLATAAAITLLGGAAYAQQPAEPAAPAPDQKPAEATTAPPPADATTPAPPASTATPAPPADTSASSTSTTTATTDTSATAATSASSNAASFANLKTASEPVPDTPENRKKYGKPMSNAGKKSAAKGN